MGFTRGHCPGSRGGAESASEKPPIRYDRRVSGTTRDYSRYTTLRHPGSMYHDFHFGFSGRTLDGKFQVRVLEADYNLNCDDQASDGFTSLLNRQWWEFFGAIMVAVYPLGVPGLFCFLLMN